MPNTFDTWSNVIWTTGKRDRLVVVFDDEDEDEDDDDDELSTKDT